MHLCDEWNNSQNWLYTDFNLDYASKSREAEIVITFKIGFLMQLYNIV